MEIRTRLKRLLRVFDPAFPPNNIYRFQARKTISLGPVMVASVAKNLLGSWLNVEVVSENNLRKKLGVPIGQGGLLDHVALQTEEPADYIGISASITSAVPRALAIIQIYRDLPVEIQPKAIVVGGWHASELPEEFITAGADVVVHGEAEPVIAQLFTALENGKGLENIPGISYRTVDSQIKRNPVTNPSYTYEGKPGHLIVPQAEMDLLPYADFGLVRFVKLKVIPHQSVRGCSGKCRFCLVKTPPRWLSPERSVREMRFHYSRGHRQFFIVDDRAEENRAIFSSTLDLLIQDRQKGRLKKLTLMTQNRLSTAQHPEILQKMWDAGVRTVAIGFESTIPEELWAMKKPLPPDKILAWTGVWKNFGFFIHAMMIFGYPIPPDAAKGQPRNAKGQVMSARERAREFWRMIVRLKPDTLQILALTPIPGTEEWNCLESQGRIFTELGWDTFDGLHVVFQPDAPMTAQEVMRQIFWLQRKFYAFHYLGGFGLIPLVLHLIKIGGVTIAMPFVWLVLLPFKNWQPKLAWQKPARWFRNAKRQFQGHLIVLAATRQLRSFEQKLREVMGKKKLA